MDKEAGSEVTATLIRGYMDKLKTEHGDATGDNAITEEKSMFDSIFSSLMENQYDKNSQ